MCNLRSSQEETSANDTWNDLLARYAFVLEFIQTSNTGIQRSAQFKRNTGKAYLIIATCRFLSCRCNPGPWTAPSTSVGGAFSLWEDEVSFSTEGWGELMIESVKERERDALAEASFSENRRTNIYSPEGYIKNKDPLSNWWTERWEDLYGASL